MTRSPNGTGRSQKLVVTFSVTILAWGLFAYSEDYANSLDLGKRVYEEKCAACHGIDGDGSGDAAYLLYPKPRNFVAADYRLVSTWDRIPTDDDVVATITRGMPGSAMPSWGHLPESTRKALAAYVKSFSKNSLDILPDSDPPAEGELGNGVMAVPPEPSYTPEARKRAAYLYEEACATCHGATGRGDGTEEQIDNEGYRTHPRDLTRGIYKGSPTAEMVFRRIVAGMPGTPMPMSEWSYGNDAWHLTHFVLEMSSDEGRARNEMVRRKIVATRVSELPDHPESGEWNDAEARDLHLMPLWWRDDRPESLSVRALHDGHELVLLIRWSDNTHDHSTIRPQDFRDAAAIQFSLTEDPPFFGMGEQLKDVNIWMWKADREKDFESTFQDIETVYPHINADSYPDFSKSPAEQPIGSVSTLDSDPIFVSGWGAGNIVSDPTFEKSVEDLKAGGFGTLKARPRIDQSVDAEGSFSVNTYSVMFRRSLNPKGEDSVHLQAGATVPVAFAVWDGSAGDRDGRKSVTIWQDLILSP